MQPNQKSVGANGLQNALFPLTTINISQGENGSYSHRGTFAIDFVGRTGRTPYYAPCDMKCVYNMHNGGGIVWESINNVNLINGTIGVLRVCFYHDNTADSIAVGSTRVQGQEIGKTGTAGNVTGDHVHMEMATGRYTSGFPLYENPYGIWMLKGATHIYDMVGVNDTQIINGYGYNWRQWSNTPNPPVINSIEMRDEGNRFYAFQGKASASTGGTLSRGSIKIEMGATILYKWSGAVSGTSWTTAWDRKQILQGGTVKYTLTVTDTLNRTTTQSKNFTIPNMPSPPLITNISMNERNNRVFEFNSRSEVGSGASLESAILRLTFNGSIIYNETFSISGTSWISNPIRIELRKGGKILFYVKVTDNYGRNDNKEKEFTIPELPFKDDIIPLYMMNILNGGFSPK